MLQCPRATWNIARVEVFSQPHLASSPFVQLTWCCQLLIITEPQPRFYNLNQRCKSPYINILCIKPYIREHFKKYEATEILSSFNTPHRIFISDFIFAMALARGQNSFPHNLMKNVSRMHILAASRPLRGRNRKTLNHPTWRMINEAEVLRS